MKKIIIALALTTIALASCWKENPATNEQTQKWPGNVPTQETVAPWVTSPWAANLKAYEDVLSWVKDIYKDKPIFKACMSQAATNCSDQAVTAEAWQKQDIKICDDLVDNFARKGCKEGIVIALAKKDLDSSKCNELEDSKVNCLSQVVSYIAFQKKDASICEQLSNITENEKNWSWTIAMMPWLAASYFKDSCINSIAQSIVDKNSIQLCDKISDTSLKSSCKSMLEMRREAMANSWSGAPTPNVVDKNPVPTPPAPAPVPATSGPTPAQ